MHRVAQVGFAAVLLASCSSSARHAATTASSTTRTTIAVAPSASLHITGDRALAGDVVDASVVCSFPTVDGLQVSVFAHAPDSRISYRMLVAADKVFVNVDSGAGATFRERNFQGRGVSAFDVAKGAQLDSQLLDTAPSAGVAPGSIGRITAVKGSVNCGNQTPGSSTITVTGTSRTGRYHTSRLDPVLVECYFNSGQLSVIGITRAGNENVQFLISLGSDGVINVEEAPAHAAQRYYGSVSGLATLTSNGGRAHGDVVERKATPPHTLHIEGSATCGTPMRD
ncbi:MAG TPA: hypothetical protein VEZ15_12780 [Acidimicrobiia bacterium]|nr:hypothetical protein [Acidimicrobiia bacterium]